MQRIITITGPDGAGKSTVADALAESLSHHGEVRRFHHRLRGLPSSQESLRATTTPQDNTTYGRVVSAGKILYLFADDVIGWITKARPVLRGGGSVIVERGWWDLVVDPRRYRLRGASRLTRALGRALPGERTTIILDAPPSVMRERKPELPTHEIARQLEVWRELGATLAHAFIVSVDRPVDEVHEEVARISGAIGRADGAPRPMPPGRWISVKGSNRRLTVSTASPRAAARSLDLHQPMRLTHLIAWRAAKLAGAGGALRLLPGVAEPRMRQVLDDHVPRGGTIALLGGASPDRAVALILDGGGHALAIAKVALDDDGRRKLAIEADATARFGPLLDSPLTAPRVLEVGDGVVVFEVVPWRPRLRPWALPEEVARSLGRLHRARLDGSTSLGHGDFAPWNVMRSANGWHVIDWEEAGSDRPDFEDVFHYVVQGHALLGRPHLQEVLDGIGLHGPVGRAICAYADASGADLGQVSTRFTEYLESSQRTLLPRPDRAMGMVARENLLRHLPTTPTT